MVLRRTWALEPIPPRRGGDGTVAYDVDADEEVARDADEEGMPDANNGVWAVLFKKKNGVCELGLSSARKSDCE